jgi:hypothetical protein
MNLKRRIVHMLEIQNYDIYTTRMQKSMYDKMFFVDKIFDEGIDTFIDFGCADAELMCHLRVFMPKVRFIGYDIDENMLAKAREKAPWAEFYSNWDDIEVDPKKTVVNLSSVLHEIYHYGSHQDIELFWERLRKPGFAYITIRDMFAGKPMCYDTEWRKKILAGGYGEQLRDFENYWGPIHTSNDLIHFLLKYRYKENWEREVRENYIPITPESLMRRLHEYTAIYSQFSSLPYIVNQVQKDFNINIADIPTHFKAILKNNE